MEVKGIVTKSIAEYVKANYPQQYVEWENLLPVESISILDHRLALNLWHDSEIGVEKPTEALAHLFFAGDIQKAAWLSGRYSAEKAFNGVFRKFLLILSPILFINKAHRLWGTFYRPSKTSIEKITDTHIKMQIQGMTRQSELIEYRIGGWTERVFELANSKNVKIRIAKSFAIGDEFTEFDIQWD